jgi:ArsR family transcriptional regulator
MMHDRLKSQKCARLLKAMADHDRLKIIQCLGSGPKNVTDLAQSIGSVLANVSHHLGKLRRAGLVQVKKEGRFVMYSLHPDVFQPEEPGVANLGCCRLRLGSC